MQGGWSTGAVLVGAAGRRPAGAPSFSLLLPAGAAAQRGACPAAPAAGQAEAGGPEGGGGGALGPGREEPVRGRRRLALGARQKREIRGMDWASCFAGLWTGELSPYVV